jgi:hypothetical protein
MKKIFSFILTLILCSFLSVGAQSVQASGYLITPPQQQLQVNNQDGVVYVTTTVATSSSSIATSSTQISTQSSLFSAIFIPKGFILNVSDLINLLLRIVLVISAILVFMFLIWGAMQWITSGGEKSKTEAARNRMVSAIIGLIIVVTSFAIMTLIVRILGFNSFNDVLLLLERNDSPTATTSSQLKQQNLVP